MVSLFFFFNDTATTEIYTLSLHDALPISNPLELRNFLKKMPKGADLHNHLSGAVYAESWIRAAAEEDRKSTRLNSSHSQISYAVFCLKKKNNSKVKIHVLDH